MADHTQYPNNRRDILTEMVNKRSKGLDQLGTQSLVELFSTTPSSTVKLG